MDPVLAAEAEGETHEPSSADSLQMSQRQANPSLIVEREQTVRTRVPLLDSLKEKATGWEVMMCLDHLVVRDIPPAPEDTMDTPPVQGCPMH